MTNREKYKDEILDLLRKGDSVDVMIFYDTHIATKYDVPTYVNISLVGCILGVILWMDEEYEEPIKTRQSEFLKTFPNTKLHNGVVQICPKSLGLIKQCLDVDICPECHEKYWLAEVEND